MNKFEVGDKVVIRRLARKSWAQWAWKSMPGRTAVIEEVKPDYMGQGHLYYLVRFDKPIPGDRPGRLPTVRFHFAERFLRTVTTP